MGKQMAVELPSVNVESSLSLGTSTELIRLMEDFSVTEPSDKLIKNAGIANLRESTQNIAEVFAATMKDKGVDGLGDTDVIDTLNVLIRSNGLPDRGSEESMLSICTFDYGGNHVLETVICAPVNGENGLVQPSEEYKVALLVHLGVLEAGQTMEDFLAKMDEHEFMSDVPSAKYENIGVKASRDGAYLDVVQRIIPLCEEELLQSISSKVESLK